MHICGNSRNMIQNYVHFPKTKNFFLNKFTSTSFIWSWVQQNIDIIFLRIDKHAVIFNCQFFFPYARANETVQSEEQTCNGEYCLMFNMFQ